MLFFCKFADTLFFFLAILFLHLGFGCSFGCLFFRLALRLFFLGFLLQFLGLAGYLFGFPAFLILDLVACIFLGFATFLDLFQRLLNLLHLRIMLLCFLQGFPLDIGSSFTEFHVNGLGRRPRTAALDTQFTHGLTFECDLAGCGCITFRLTVC